MRPTPESGSYGLALPADHPGVSDVAYRARRAAIADAGERYRSGEPIPQVEYSDEEHALWRLVATELARKHERFACEAARAGAIALALPADEVPQLQDVSRRLGALTGFRVEPVPGLVPPRRFYGALADRCFLSTQYMRHTSVPFYTPEPDLVHEVVGHCSLLADPVFARLHRMAGEASQRAQSEAALDFFSRVFWFTLEFGVLVERGELRCYGAGLLSSFGEIEVFRNARIRPFDIGAMGRTDYDITTYQPVLFAADGVEQAAEELGAWFEAFDDACFASLPRRRGAGQSV
jgi:phenylalanine-4-hydroxylase